MAAVVLTLALTLLVAGIVWLVLGSRFQFQITTRSGDDTNNKSAEPRDSDAPPWPPNDLLNLLAYAGISAPFVFVLVFYLVEHL